MKKRLLKAAITTALSVSFAVPALAGSFSDVPAKHWAYDAVNKLAQEGIVTGYADGTFRGDKTISRYEMAEIVSKAMNKKMNADQKAIVERLSREYAAELNTINEKVSSQQNLLDQMVKFTGDAHLRLFDVKNPGATREEQTDYQLRLAMTAKVNNDTDFFARITTGDRDINTTGNAGVTVDNVYVSTKLFGVDTKIGRQDYSLGQGLLAGSGSTAIINGISLKDGNFTVVGGKEAKSASVMVPTYGAEYSFDVMGAPVAIDYLRTDKKDYYAASTSFNLFQGFKLSGEYARNNTDKANAYAIKGDIGTTGLAIAYKDIQRGSVPFESGLNLMGPSTSSLQDFYALSQSYHVKGMEYSYDKTIAKNTDLNVIYQDIQHHGKNVRATVNVKF